MATHTEFGKLGEDLTRDFLVREGYTILYRNWRHSHYEIDIVALKNDLLHFVEVKTRSSTEFGEPETSVSKRRSVAFCRRPMNLNTSIQAIPTFAWISYR